MVAGQVGGEELPERRLVAFLRGINLGNRRLKMDELRGHFEALDLEGVATYLSSGNVVFDAAGDPAGLEARVEAHLEARLGYDVDTFIRVLPELGPLLALELTEAEAGGFKPHVMFLKEEVDDAAERSLAALESSDDLFRSLGREVVWLRRGGLSDSPISHGDLDRALGGRTGTMRTLNTVRRIVAKFGNERGRRK